MIHIHNKYQHLENVTNEPTTFYRKVNILRQTKKWLTTDLIYSRKSHTHEENNIS